MPNEIRQQLVSSDNQTWISVESYCRQLMRRFEPDGIEQLRSFVDGAAKKAFDSIDQSDDMSELSRQFHRYFFSAYGDRLANKLADAFFQNGEFLQAARLWERILNEYPESELSPTRLLTKQAYAYSRAQEREAFEEVAAKISLSKNRESVAIGGKNVDPLDVVKELRQSFEIVKATHGNPIGSISISDQLKCRQWSTFWSEMRDGHDRIPSLAKNDRILVASLGDVVAGFDYRTGKLLWTHRAVARQKTVSPPKIPKGGIRIFRNQSEGSKRMSLSVPRPACDADFVFAVLQAEPRDQHLSVVHALDAQSGKQIWTSDKVLSGWQLISNLESVNGLIWVLGHDQQSDQITIFALNATLGTKEVSIPLGRVFTASEFGRSNVYGRLERDGNCLFGCLPGAIVAIDVDLRTVRWLYRMEATIQNQAAEPEGLSRIRNIVLNDQTPVNVTISENRIFVGTEQLIACLNKENGEQLWKTNDKTFTAFVGSDRQQVFALSIDHAFALDSSTGEITWESPLRNHFWRGTVVDRQLIIPASDGLHLFDINSKRHQLRETPFEFGPTEQVILDRGHFLSVSRKTVTLLSKGD